MDFTSRTSECKLNVRQFLCMLCLSIGSLLSFNELALAANVERVQGSSIGCTVKLTGTIVDGDAEKVGAVLGEAYQLEGPVRFCFDSPGGSYLEGLEIAKVNHAPTGVDEGDRCESACFLAFMSGNKDRMEDRVYLADRVMHPRAKVGFHAPSLNVDSGSFSSDELNKAYQIALQTIAELLKLREEKNSIGIKQDGFVFRDSLLEEMLRVSPQQMKYIQTIGQAVEYQIAVYPVVLPGSVPDSVVDGGYANTTENHPGFANVCQALGGMSDKFYVDGGGETPEITSLGKDGFIYKAGFNVGESVTECTLVLNEHPSPPKLQDYGIWAQHTVSWSIGSASVKDYWIPQNDFEVGAHMFYPPTTEIAGMIYRPGYRSINNKFLARFNTEVSASCAVRGSTVEIVNVQNFTNMRRQAGLNGQVLAQVPLGAQVSVINPGSFLRYDRCAATCNGTNQNAIKQCIDNNDVWIEVQYNGRRGFLSRKFLE